MQRSNLDRLVRPVSRALAHAYACGWKQHAQLVGEMQGMTPDEWADANAEMFTQEATDAIWPNVSFKSGPEK